MEPKKVYCKDCEFVSPKVCFLTKPEDISCSHPSSIINSDTALTPITEYKKISEVNASNDCPYFHVPPPIYTERQFREIEVRTVYLDRLWPWIIIMLGFVFLIGLSFYQIEASKPDNPTAPVVIDEWNMPLYEGRDKVYDI